MPSGGKERPRLFLLACALLLSAYGVLLFSSTSFSAALADTSVYLNSARLLARGRIAERVQGPGELGLPDRDRALFIPIGFAPGGEAGTMVPAYPPGLPLHMAFAARLFGWTRAPFLVVPLAALLSLVLIYLVGRELELPRALAVASAALLGVFPTFLSYALLPVSDVPATFWTLAAVLTALRSRRGPNWAYLSGACLGAAVLVRPTSALLMAPLLFALPWSSRVFFRFLLGGLPFAGFLFLYNQAAFGHPIATGYGTLLKGAMALDHFPDRIRHYGFWLAMLMSPWTPLAWMTLVANRRVSGRDRALLILWFGSFLLFFCFYEPYAAWSYTRFLLPGIPALILGALITARDLPSRSALQPTRLAVALLLFAAALCAGIYHIARFRVLDAYKEESASATAARWTRERLPAGSLFVCSQMSGPLHFYTDRIAVRLDLMSPDRFTLLRSHTEQRGYRWYALVPSFEVGPLERRLPGEWREVARIGAIRVLRIER